MFSRLRCIAILAFTLLALSGCGPAVERPHVEAIARDYIENLIKGHYEEAYELLVEEPWGVRRPGLDTYALQFREHPLNLNSFSITGSTFYEGPESTAARVMFTGQSLKHTPINGFITLEKVNGHWLVNDPDPAIMQTGEKYNWREPIIHASSLEHMESYFYKRTPGLEWAENSGLVTPAEVSREIPGTGLNVRIEKVWYSSKEVYVFYSQNAPYGVVKPVYLKARLLSPNVPNQHPQGAFSGDIGPGEGVIYDGRFYSRAVFNPIENSDHHLAPKVNDIVLELEIDSMGDERKKTILDPIRIPVNFDTEKEPRYNYRLNKSIDTGYGVLTFEMLEAGITGNKLYFSFNGDHPVYELDAHVTTSAGDKRKIWSRAYQASKNEYLNKIPLFENTPVRANFEHKGNTSGKEKCFVVDFDAFNKKPRRISISVDAVRLVSDKSLTFTVDVSRYRTAPSDKKEVYVAEVMRPIGKFDNSIAYLQNIVRKGKGISFGLLYETTGGPTPPYRKLVATMPKSDAVGQELNKNGLLVPNVVQISGLKKELKGFGSGHGPGERMSFSIDNEFIDWSSNLRVKVKNLSYAVVGDGWNAEIELTKSNY